MSANRKFLAESVVNSLLNDEKPVIVRDKIVKDSLMICPHCNEEIHEKSTFVKEGKDIHGPCGGVIKFPSPSQDEIDYMKKNWGIDLSKPA